MLGIYTYYIGSTKYIYKLSICSAYAPQISRVGVHDLVSVCVHMFGICTAYLVHAVATGKLWLSMRVLYRQKCNHADLLPAVLSVTTLNFC
jgi:hypothetical protein